MRVKNRTDLVIQQALCLLLAALVTLGVCIGMHSREDIAVPSDAYADLMMPKNSVSIWKDAKVKLVNASMEDGMIVGDPEKMDSELFFEMPDGKAEAVQSVAITLKEPFYFDYDCMLFYPTPKGIYTEKCKVVFTLPEGRKTMYFAIPSNVKWKFSELRLDVDLAYAIEDIRISPDELSSDCHPWKGLRLEAVLICYLLMAAVFEGILLLSQYIARRIFYGREAYRERKDLRNSGQASAEGSHESGSSAGPEDLRESGAVAGVTGRPKWTLCGIFCFWLAIAAICVLIYFESHEYSWQTARIVPSFLSVYVFTGILAITIGLFYRLWYRKAGTDPETYINTYALVFFLSGLFYIALFLPFVSPDETSHYKSAYRVANVILGNIGQIGDDRLLLRRADYDFFNKAQLMLTKEYYLQTAKDFALFAKDAGYVVMDAPMVSNAIFSYFATGLGVALGLLLHLSPLLTFYLGRVANLLLFAVMIKHLLRKMPVARSGIFVMAMTPMTLHMVASFSYDTTTYGLVMLFVGQVMFLMAVREKAERKELWICLLYAVMMAPSKLVFAVLLAMVLLIPYRNINEDIRKAWVWKLGIMTAGAVSVIVIMVSVNLVGEAGAIRNMLEDNAAVHMIKWAQEEGYTVSWVLTHPLQFIAVVTRTAIMMLDHYFFTMLGSSLGWLDIPLPHIFGVISFIMFVLAVNARDPSDCEWTVTAPGKLWVVILCAGCAGITLLAMLLDWTPLSYNYIVGVQGRYFLPLMMPMMLLVRTPQMQVGRRIQDAVIPVMVYLNLWVLIYIFTTHII